MSRASLCMLPGPFAAACHQWGGYGRQLLHIRVEAKSAVSNTEACQRFGSAGPFDPYFLEVERNTQVDGSCIHTVEILWGLTSLLDFLARTGIFSGSIRKSCRAKRLTPRPGRAMLYRILSTITSTSFHISPQLWLVESKS